MPRERLAARGVDGGRSHLNKKNPVGAMRRTGFWLQSGAAALCGGGATIYGSLMSTP